ncbi:MAG: CIS tube protein, partial [Bacillota bacterium]
LVKEVLGLPENVKLEKLKFTYAGTYDDLDKSGAESFEVLFNPTEFNLDRENQIGETPIPGLENPVMQFVNGRGRTLSMQLFIDTTEAEEAKRDASEAVAKVTGLLTVRADTHAPPLLRVDWGALKKFTGVLTSAKVRFLLFNYKGVPLRATIDIGIREYKPIRVQLRDPRRESPDRTKLRALRQGETLSALAHEEYGNAGQWRLIAERNRIDDPRRVAPGTLLEIPPLPKSSGDES